MVRKIFALMIVSAAALNASAKGTGSSSGLILLKNSGARSAALGEAFVSMSDDVTAMEFNPASLATLGSGHMSLQYERGVFDDAFSKAMIGVRAPFNAILGVSAGYYNSGSAVLFDGVTQRSVVAQRDVLANVGLGFRFSRFDAGVGVKYLKSELAETNGGSASSADIGFQYQLFKPLRLGASGPLYQTKLRYGNQDEELPKVYRAGLGWDANLKLATGKIPLKILFDVPYYADERESAVALGAETRLGIVALRLGTNTRSHIQQFAMGAGVSFSRASLDYSFGLADKGDFDSVHKVNFSFRFDDFRDAASAGKKDDMAKRKPAAPSRMAIQIVELKPGETLEALALRLYGSESKWRDIYSLNRGLYASPDDIKPGTRILAPARVE